MSGLGVLLQRETEVTRNWGRSRVTTLCETRTQHPCPLCCMLLCSGKASKQKHLKFFLTDFSHHIFSLFGSIPHAPQQKGKFQTITDCIFCYFSHAALIEHTAFGKCESCKEKRQCYIWAFSFPSFFSQQNNFCTSKDSPYSKYFA